MRLILVMFAVSALLLPSVAGVSPGAPHVRVDNFLAWIGHTLLAPQPVTAEACDSDGALESLVLEVEGYPASVIPGPARCLTATVFVEANQPGTLRARAAATDDDGNTMTVLGGVRVVLLPFDTATVPGFPRLEDTEEPLLGPSVRIDVTLAPDGSARGARAIVGGHVYADSYTTTMPNPEDTDWSLVFQLRASTATLAMNGTPAWSGLVRQSDDRWWHIAPVSDAGLLHDALTHSL